MPIFQEDLGSGRGTPPSKLKIPSRSTSPLSDRNLTRKSSEESIRTDLCEGPITDVLGKEQSLPAGSVDSNFIFPKTGISDRIELIERLKRGESPTWLPNRNLESLLKDVEQTPRKSLPTKTDPSPLLPSPEISKAPSKEDERSQAGLQIERPRSALHSGDFTEGTQTRSSEHGLISGRASEYSSEQSLSSWIATSPPRHYTPFQLETRFPAVDRADNTESPRSRAPSLSSSYSSSFVLKAPTSPLVQSESNEELDLSSQMNPIDISSPYQRKSRRHTLQASHSVYSTPTLPTSSSFNKPLPLLRRDNIMPYQAHQPRRSLTTGPLPHPASSPQTPSHLRSRRPSYTSDNSPLHHASMVGSYEESILRGRMSTTPSKPLDFVAQIGVLGIGKCKPNLRCPAHVTIPFPAVFYSYETTSHGRAAKSEDGPSPYVGQIDLENTLSTPSESRDHKRKRLSANIAQSKHEDLEMVDSSGTNQLSELEIRRVEKQKRRSTSPRAPPGGSYRIPEKGQLQIIIKNPNKTAVKLFLVPYDLTGMDPGTKTFIRQRSYSAGPIIDSALSSTPQTSDNSSLDRSTLRYLIHLQICSPARGRFYLYKSIRVVFANRVPDGKEKLRNEISMPEPRFSVYKPGRDTISTFTGGAGASLAAEKAAYRRRSSGFVLGFSHRTYDTTMTQTLDHDFSEGVAFPYGRGSRVMPVQPIPFSLFHKNLNNEDDDFPDKGEIQSPTSSRSSRPTTASGSRLAMSFDSNSTDIVGYDKLSKGDVGYGGNAFNGSPGTHIVAEGLLAKKLRDLGVGIQNQQDQTDGL